MTVVPFDKAFEILTFGLDGEVFAVEATAVLEILDVVPVTEVPGARPFVNGLINVRGKVVPLADLRLRFGMARTPDTIDTRFVVLEAKVEGEPILAGIRAEKVYEVTEIAASSIEHAPRVGMKWRPEFIRGVGKKDDGFINILDLDRIFSADELAAQRA